MFKSHNAFNRKAAPSVGAVQTIARLYEEQKTLLKQLNAQRHARSTVGDRIRENAKDPQLRQAALEEAKALKFGISKLEWQLEDIEQRLYALALALPNDTHPLSPIGPESVAATLSTHGPAPIPASPSRDHVSICRTLELLDLEAGALVTGSSWYYLKNEGALLELALINYALSVAMKYGFTPVVTPDVVRSDVARRCGFQPRDPHVDSAASQMYHLADAEESLAPELVLAGTAEIPLAGMFANKILSAHELPAKVVGLGHAFRAEAGARGADTRGLYRVHQFTKLELFVVAEDKHSEEIMDEMKALQIEIYEGLGIPFRYVCSPLRLAWASPLFPECSICPRRSSARARTGSTTWRRGCPGAVIGARSRPHRTAPTTKHADCTFATAARRLHPRGLRLQLRNRPAFRSPLRTR